MKEDEIRDRLKMKRTQVDDSGSAEWPHEVLERLLNERDEARTSRYEDKESHEEAILSWGLRIREAAAQRDEALATLAAYEQDDDDIAAVAFRLQERAEKAEAERDEARAELGVVQALHHEAVRQRDRNQTELWAMERERDDARSHAERLREAIFRKSTHNLVIAAGEVPLPWADDLWWGDDE
jgi:hypothetical protein